MHAYMTWFRGFLFLYICFSPGIPAALAQTCQWVAGLGGSLQDRCTDIGADAFGNIYATGTFEGTADFDPGPGVVVLSSNGGTDCFVLKMDASGSLLWVAGFGGTGVDAAHAITTGPGGSCYITGYFRDSADFDPGPASYMLTAAGEKEGFVLHLDANGNRVWANAMRGVDDAEGNAVATGSNGDVFIAGSFSGQMDPDPGSGVYNLVSAGNTDAFITRLDAGGNFIWSGSVGGPDSDAAYAVASDAAGNVLACGTFYDVADFDPSPAFNNLGASLYNDAFVVKWSASRNLVWARNIGGPGTDMAHGLACAVSGDVFVTGFFMQTADFDTGPGTLNLTAQGGRDVFLCRLDPGGNLVWAITPGGVSDDVGLSVDLDDLGNPYLGGYFYSSAEFDPGPGSTVLNASGYRDAFVAAYDMNGQLSWARCGGGPAFDESAAVSAGYPGNVYMAGSYIGTAVFGTQPVISVVSNGWKDGFITRYFTLPAGDGETVTETSVQVFPNPTSGPCILDLGMEMDKVEITVWTALGTRIAVEPEPRKRRIELELPGSPGVFFIRVTDHGRSQVIRVLKN